MRFVKYESPRLFLNKVGEFLEKKEAVNNLLLGISNRESIGEQISDSFMCSVESSLILVILLNNKNLIIYGEGPECEKAVKISASKILHLGLEVPGVVGPIDVASQFALEWASLNKTGAYVKMQQKIYKLDKVSAVSHSQGYLRMADLNDLPLVSDWINDFASSINEQMTLEESTKKAQEFINDSSLFLWVDQVPVCMAKKARPTKNGIVITYVYTPPHLRNKGYATSCVSSLSQLLLNEGNSFCALYTDLSNPTSNQIYQ